MTDTAVSAAPAPGALPAHPLAPVTGAEFRAGRQVLAAAGLLAEPVRFAYYGLEEPPKGEVLAAGGAPERRLRAFLIDISTGESSDVVLSLTTGAVVSRRVLDPRADGQLPIIDGDFAAAEEIVRADPGWRAAMARRGLTDVAKIRACPLTAGWFGVAEEEGRRMVRVLAFVQAREHDLAWAHPVDGLSAYVDLVERRVFRLVDEFEADVPAESGDYDDPAVRGPHRDTLRPIEITQPDGPSFTVDGHRLDWQGWSMRIGFDAREGLTLHQVSIAGRPVLYRAAVPEMVVPYGDPRFRYWQAYFDSGEYLVGKFANSLELGCDCLGDITYLDATVADDFGEPRVIRNAICIHEEDYGILWKHTDIFNGSAQSRRQRRLVVSFFTTVGNYDYGFYWYFYLDG
ncbi:MAG TPA: histamine oxidase, partial [Streptosporangiaceae bacterium]